MDVSLEETTQSQRTFVLHVKLTGRELAALKRGLRVECGKHNCGEPAREALLEALNELCDANHIG